MMIENDEKKASEIVLETIRNRRSIFPPAFNDLPVSEQEIKKILEAANYAPTHKLTQPWRFIVLRGQAKISLGQYLLRQYEEIAPEILQLEKKRKKLVENPLRASAIIAICMVRDAEERVPEWEELAATACAVQNLWLAATALGIGGYWSTPVLQQEVTDFLQLAERQRCLGFYYLGHYDRTPPPINRTSWQEKVVWRED